MSINDFKRTILIFAPLFSHTALGQSPNTLPENPGILSKSQYEKEYENTKKNLLQQGVLERKIMSTLYEISRKMKKIITEKSTLEQQKMLYEDSIKILSEKNSELENKLKLKRDLVKKRLIALYKLGGRGIANLIFSSTTASDLDRNLKFLGSLAKHDLSLIRDYSSSMEELNKSKTALAKRLAELNNVFDQIRQRESWLLKENTDKATLLDYLRSSQKESLLKLSRLRTESTQLAKEADSGLLDPLFSPSFTEYKNTLPKPVNGPIVKAFGIVRDREKNLSFLHKGVVFSVPVNTPVKSVFDGTVAFVGNVHGYGQTIIVDHGDHYYSVYGNNKSVVVHPGKEIRQNQILSYSGEIYNYENQTRMNGLYFEIRHFSEPYDPESWLKGSL